MLPWEGAATPERCPVLGSGPCRRGLELRGAVTVGSQLASCPGRAAPWPWPLRGDSLLLPVRYSFIHSAAGGVSRGTSQGRHCRQPSHLLQRTGLGWMAHRGPSSASPGHTLFQTPRTQPFPSPGCLTCSFELSQRHPCCLLFQRRPRVCPRRAKATAVPACDASHLLLLLRTLEEQPNVSSHGASQPCGN